MNYKQMPKKNYDDCVWRFGSTDIKDKKTKTLPEFCKKNNCDGTKKTAFGRKCYMPLYEILNNLEI